MSKKNHFKQLMVKNFIREGITSILGFIAIFVVRIQINILLYYEKDKRTKKNLLK